MWSQNSGSGGYNLDWEYASNGQVPSNSVEGGRDSSGENYFVGRARHNNKFLVPGKVQPSHRCIYYSFDGKENTSNTYEVLVNRTGREHLNWVQASGSQIPPNAVLCGHQENDEKTFIGRHWHEGALVIGKVQPSHGCLYIPFAGKEVQYKEYEILVSNETPAFNPNTDMGAGYNVGVGNVPPGSGNVGVGNVPPSSGPAINPWGSSNQTATAFNPNSDRRR